MGVNAVAKQVAKKTYNSFVKGLITEASPLTFPENASVDEDNCVLYRKGNRSRRNGIDFETDYQASSYNVVVADIADYAFYEYEWNNINNTSNISFLVHQVGLTLYFYDQGVDPLSSAEKGFTVNLSSYLAPGASSVTAKATMVSMTSGKGYLFVASEYLDPIIVSYNEDADSITVSRIYVLIRDLQGLDDGLANDEEPTTLSSAHNYNLLNQGWTQSEGSAATVTRQYFGHYGVFGSNSTASYQALEQTVITKYFGFVGRYPGNNKQWWVGKSTDQIFDPNVLNRSFWGTTLAPKGHFIVNTFYIDRSAMSGVSGIAVESTTERPLDISFFSGRVWYLAKDVVYFSQLLDKKGSNAGFCYQDQDPTAETLNELVASDGGVIPIPELGRGVRLVPMGQGLLVFGTKGVWFISGTSAGFSATELSVAKVSSVGTDAPKSVVVVEDKIFWMSKTGIQGLTQKSGTFGPVFGNFDQANVSLQTIQTFYIDNVPDEVRMDVKVVYDKVNNIVQWLFRTSDITHKNFYNRVLNFDLALQAFYPWTISDDIGCYITGAFSSTNFINTDTAEIVTDGGVTVTDSGVNVTNTTTEVSILPTFIKFICVYPVSTNYKATFALFNNTNFADWQKFDLVGLAYNSYVDAGYEILESPTQRKQTPYVWCFFRRTEDQYLLDGTDYELDNQSSCMFRTKWDWASSSVSNKWSREVEAYRLKRIIPVDPNDLTFDTGFPIVITKNKVRGSGRALTFRFSCDDIGKNFDLLGWAVDYNVNQQGSN